MAATPSNTDRPELDAAIQSIDRLLDELAALAEQVVPADRFYQELLDRAVLAVDAVAAAIWTEGPGEQLHISAQSQTDRIYPNLSHSRYRLDREQLGKVAKNPSSQARILEPSGETTIVCCPLQIPGRSPAVLAVYCAAAHADASLRIHQQFVVALAELAIDYEKNRRVLQHEDEIRQWQSLNACAVAAYRSLDPRQTAFEIVNEGRTFLRCDRLTVFREGAWGLRILAASGLATLDARSEVVRRIRSLAKRVLKSGEPFVYREGVLDIPDPIQKVVSPYLRETRATQVIVIPLLDALSTQSESIKPRSVMVIELLESSEAPQLLERSQLIATHAASAMNRALEYHSIPLRPIWKTLRWLLSLFRLRQIIRPLLVLLALVAVVLPLVFVQTDFLVETRGELRPSVERHVFAPVDGFVRSLEVTHGVTVKANQLVAELQSPELQREFERVNGELLTVEKKLVSRRIAMSETNPNDTESLLLQRELATEIGELEQQQISLQEQKRLLEIELAELDVRSPISGQVVTWQIEEILPSRPVRRGESLLKVADVDGDWQMELKVADRKIGYVLDARRKSQEPLPIHFVIETDPDHVFSAEVVTVASSATVSSQEPAYVRVVATFDKSDVTQLRPGATVVAKVNCGRRSIGYVWLHDLIDSVQRRFFW